MSAKYFVFLFALGVFGLSHAQTPPDIATKQVNATRVSSAPTIDGALDEPEWATATKHGDFLQVEPVEYRSPSERTEFYVLYDENAIYVGVYLYDSQPENITNQVLRQSSPLRSDDRISLYLDPFNNQRGGYQFQINPNGLISEAIYISGTRPSFDWEGIWHGNAQIVDDGWTAEFEIPFKSLSFDPTNSTWGLNLARDLQREQEEMAWYSLNGEVNPASSGKVHGISNVTQGIGLDVVPSLSGSYMKDHMLNVNDSNVEPSLDLFYKITPQINLAVTLNTDFSATEADTNSLNTSRFRRFFEEKRAFFLNDFDAFNFGLTNLQLNGDASGNNALAFYSRRIGLGEDGAPVDIDGGVKLSGRLGDTEFGALVMRQDEYLLENSSGSELIDPTNAVVVRLAQPIFAESKIGAIYTNGNPAENQDNSLIGFDFQYRDTEFMEGKSLNGVLLYQQTDDPDFDDHQSSYTAVVSVASNGGWYGGAQYFVVEENYSPGLGFTQRTDAELFSGNLTHSWLFENSDRFQEISSGLTARRWTFFESGDLDTSYLQWNVANIDTRSGHEYSFRLSREKEVVMPGRNPTGDLGFTIDPGEYTQNRARFAYEAPGYLSLIPELEVSHGDYYSGTSTTIGPSIEWQANRHVTLGGSYELTRFDFPEGDVYTREVELDMSIAFNSSLSLVSQIEYNNVNREVAFTNRLRWNLEPGRDLWIVFNQGYIDRDGENSFVVEDTNAAFKLIYTFRY